MKQRYEYKFVRIGEGWLGVKKQAMREYPQLVEQYARDGWRLVQILTPGTGAYGMAQYLELILERPVE